MSKPIKATAVSPAAPASADDKGVSKPVSNAGQPDQEASFSGITMGDIASFLPGAKEHFAAVETNGSSEHEEVEEEAESVGEEPTEETSSETEGESIENGDASSAEEVASENSEEIAPADETEENDPEHQEWPESARKRLGKVTAQKKEALSRAEKAEAENLKLKADLDTASASTGTRLAPTPDQPLADAMTEADVQRKVDIARQMKIWAMKNPEGGIFKLGEKEFELDADAAKEHMVNAEMVISEYAPQRRQYLKALEACTQDAKRIYPNLFDSSKPEHQVLQKTLQRMPWLQTVPNYALIIGDAIRGQTVRLSEEAEAAKPKVKPVIKAPMKAPARAVAPKKPVEQVNRGGKFQKFVDSGGSTSSLTELMESML